MNHPAYNPTARVFFALWSDVAESLALATWQEPLKHLCGGRAMGSETLHSTLVFIGEIELHKLQALQLAAQEIRATSFVLCFDSAHYWGHNHIVYAAPNRVPPQLVQLVGALKQCLATHHFKFDQREYKPHVTLLRNARWIDAPLPVMEQVCWPIRDFVLVQSAPRGGLTDYRVLARFPLHTSGG